MPDIYEVLTAYADAQDRITKAVKGCLVKPVELAKAIGIKKSQFYDRLRLSNWRPDEMQTLAGLLDSSPTITIGGSEVH